MSISSQEIAIEQAIVRNPLTIAANATVAEAIALMSVGSRCDLICDINSEISLQLAHAQTSCVLVTENQKLVGILTERDLVSFCGQSEVGNSCRTNKNLAETAIAEVMVYPVHSLLEWEFTDLLVPLNRFQRYGIRHLPIVNDAGEVVGLVTHESLRQLLRPIDMLHLRQVKEIMVTQVISAEVTKSITQIANLMITHQVSSIVIGEYREAGFFPSGIITESDVVQYLALELDLSTTQAHTVMSFPLASITPEDTLWRVREIMQDRMINHLVVTDNDGIMQGIVSQTDVLKTLQPKEVYKLVSLLETKMYRLEQEKLELLESRNRLLEKQVQESKEALLVSKDMFQQFADNNRSVVLIRDLKTGKLLYVNSAYSQIWGVSTESLYQDPLSWMNAIHPEDLPQFNKAYELTANTGFFNHEYRIIRPDGSVRWIWGRCFPLNNSKGECDRMAAIAEDISDRKNAQVALQESEAELRNLFASMQDYIFVINRQGVYVKSFPNHPETAHKVGQSLHSLFVKTTADRFLTTIQEVLDSQQSKQIDYCIPVQNRDMCFSTIVSPLSQETVLWVARDITKRKQSENELLLQQEFLTTVINTSPNLIFVKNDQGEYIMANQAIADFYETTVDNLIGKTDLDFQDNSQTDTKFQIEDRQVLSTNQTLFIAEEENNLSNQENHWFQWSKTPITLPHDASQAVLGIGVDITQRKLTEIALRESESKQKALIKALPDLIMRMSGDGIYLDFSETHTFEVLGSEALIGKSIYDYEFPKDLADIRMNHIRNALATGNIQIYEQEIYINGNLHIEEVRVAVCGENEVLVVVRDISDRKKAENNLRQSEQRLKASEALLNAMFMRSAIGIAITDINGYFVRTNTYYQELVGYSEQELRSLRFTDITNPEDVAENLKMRDLVLSDQCESYQMEKQFIHRDGYPVWVRVTSSKIIDENSNSPLFIGVVENIADRKQAEESLQSLVEGAAAQTGEDFLPAIAEYIGKSLNVRNVFITRLQEDYLKLETAWLDGKLQSQTIVPLADSPCKQTIDEGFFICSKGLKQRFPLNKTINQLGVESYVGIAIVNSKGEPVGSLCIMDDKPIIKLQRTKAMLQVFAARVSAEIEREQAIHELYQLNQQLESRVERRTRELQFANQQLIVEMAERQKLVALVENSTDFIALADLHGNITYLNPAGIKLVGLESSSFRKLSILDCYFPEDRQELKQNIIDVITNDETWEGELRLRHYQTHEEIPVLFSAFPVQNSWTDETLSLACIVRDISDRKKAEEIVIKTNEELLHTNSELARATKLKDEFLANMSHELRTPLNAILGMSEGLSTGVFGDVNERQRRSLTLIENSGRHLLELINDILDVAKIGAGKLKLEITPVAIDNLCKSSLNFVKQMASQKNIKLRLSISSELGLMELDERRMRQALINLLSNAVKFTPQGGKVCLEAKIIEADPNNSPSKDNPHHLVLAVTDTGIGIAPENMDKLFQTFVQIDSSLSRQYTGTGLGLTLVKQIAELHGGTVSVTSQENQGSCFSILLPYSSSIKSPNSDPKISSIEVIHTEELDAPEQEVNAENYPNPLILLAEDNPINVETFADYLTNRGYRLIFAVNGLEAVEQAIAHKPNLILMDIQMPLLDGLGAIQQIRANPDLQNIPIIALTALAMASDREKCLETGADEYLAKPVKLAQLAMAVKEQIRKKSSKKLSENQTQ